MWYLHLRRIILAVFALFIGLATALLLLAWNTFPVKADMERQTLVFPFLIEGTDLIAEHFVSYEGDYFEDKSGDFVIDGAALCVYNRGDDFIAFADIYIETVEGVFCFEGTCIPAHSKVVILEKYKSNYPQSPVCFAAGRTVVGKSASVLEELEIMPADLGAIEVINRSDMPMQNLCLYYKRYDSQWDMYIGGITYAIRADSLQAGERVIMRPANYANGYSKVFYATAD